jgi:hypothetical protein
VIGLAVAQAEAQAVGEEAMVTVPVSLVVQGDDEEVAFEVLQDLLKRGGGAEGRGSRGAGGRGTNSGRGGGTYSLVVRSGVVTSRSPAMSCGHLSGAKREPEAN